MSIREAVLHMKNSLNVLKRREVDSILIKNTPLVETLRMVAIKSLGYGKPESFLYQRNTFIPGPYVPFVPESTFGKSVQIWLSG